MPQYDAIIIGSGPNGIAAAVYLQQKGLKTAIFEQADSFGGATRSKELTLPGYKHDVGAAILPMGIASPFFRDLPLAKYGLEWIYPEIPYAHPFDDGSAFACYQDLQKTADQLGEDAEAYKKIFQPIVENWSKLENTLLGPLSIPKYPLELIKFGLKALPSANMLVNHFFKNEKTKAFFFGSAAHSTLPMTTLISASFGLVLTSVAHKYGWPFPKGGSINFTKALVKYYEDLGGQIFLNEKITDINELPKAKAYLFDLTPRQLLKIKNTKFSSLYRKRLENYKYGSGVFKMDWALSEPIPFKNEKCKKAGTVHLGFSAEEIIESEKGNIDKNITKTPYVLVTQQSNFDNSRAPEGKYTAWAYCHVPNGSNSDFSAFIESQIERAAPGFKDCILSTSKLAADDLQNWNPNLIGGDINGGKQDITQLFTRPIARISPYSTPDERVYICSSSTPPGGGVHGMCGYNAAKKAFKDHFQK